MAASYVASTDAEKELLILCSKDLASYDHGSLVELLKTPDSDLRVDATDENGMTALLHAAYKNNKEASQLLIERGADVNSNLQSDGYTALMFATIAGHPGMVELFLQAGARTSAVNNVGKTAAQLGAFVGQHKCVRVINNFFSMTDLEYYTIPQGLEKTPKLSPSLAPPLHRLITTTNVHPVKVIQYLRAHPALLECWGEVVRVLGLLCERMMGEEREGFSLKMHYLSFVIQQCCRSEGAAEELLKRLLTLQEDGAVTEEDRFLRQCLREFPHVHSALLKQMVATLAKIPPGGEPTTLSIIHSAILGQKSDEEKSSCSTCGEFRATLKKCSKCKQAFYCSVECQTLAWNVGNHRKLCKRWAKKLEQKQEQTGSKEQATATDDKGSHA